MSFADPKHISVDLTDMVIDRVNTIECAEGTRSNGYLGWIGWDDGMIVGSSIGPCVCALAIIFICVDFSDLHGFTGLNFLSRTHV
jgi:hypothetical protein